MIDSSFESRVYWKGVRFEGKDKGDSILARMLEDFFLLLSIYFEAFTRLVR